MQFWVDNATWAHADAIASIMNLDDTNPQLVEADLSAMLDQQVAGSSPTSSRPASPR